MTRVTSGVSPAVSERRESAATLVASIIVPARNPGPDLGRLLDALDGQTIPPERFEVIVADDGSTDAGGFAAAMTRPWVRVTPGQPLNSYAARNRAARLARGSVLAFCDADCVPAPTWLEEGLARLESCDLLAGRVEFLVPERRSIWTLLDMEGNLDQERAVRSGHAVTANLFIRRELFEETGGFEDSLPEHGDYEFVARCVDGGAELRFAHDVVVSHPTRDLRKPFLRKLWVMNWWYAARESRARRRPFLVRLRAWVPFVHTIRSRRFVGKPLGLDGRRLSEHGLEPTMRERVLTLPMLYVVLPYLAGIAQIGGWWTGRKLRGGFDSVRAANPRRFEPKAALPLVARSPKAPGA